MRRIFGLRKRKEPPPTTSTEVDVFGPTTLLLPNYKTILEFGPEENRSDSSLIINALKDDKSGSMYAIRYIDPKLIEDEEFTRNALKAVAHTYKNLSYAERRLVQFDQYGSLNKSLEEGGVKLMKGQWLVDICATGPRVKIPRRQELPPEAFLSGPVWDGVKVLVVSHCWLSGEHPDPHGERAQQLSKFVSFTQRCYPGYDVAVFWDWVSMLQHAPTPSPGTITAIQTNEDGTYNHLSVEFDENGDDGFIPPTLVESHLIPKLATWGEHEEDEVPTNSSLSFRELGTRSLSLIKSVGASASEASSGAFSMLKKMSSANMSSPKSKIKKSSNNKEAELFSVGGRISARIPRTDEEAEIHRKGLDSLHVWFGHRKCFKLLFTAHPSDILPENDTTYADRPDYDTSAWTILERFFTSTSPGLVFDMNLVNTLDLSEMSFSLVSKLCCPTPRLFMVPEEFFEFIQDKYFTVKADVELVVNAYCCFYQDWFERYAVDQVSLIALSPSVTTSHWSLYLERILPQIANSLLTLNLSRNSELSISASYFTQFEHLVTLLLSHTDVSGKLTDFENMKSLKRLDVNSCPNLSLGKYIDVNDLECDDEGEGFKTDFIFVTFNGRHFNFPISRTKEIADNVEELEVSVPTNQLLTS